MAKHNFSVLILRLKLQTLRKADLLLLLCQQNISVGIKQTGSGQNVKTVEQ